MDDTIIKSDLLLPQGNSYLLEYLPDSVTNPGNEHGAYYEVSKCRCESWFCPDCCVAMGYKLRARLIPVLGTFQGLLMVTFTVDPLLFPDPKTAYLYIQKRRCIGRTTQDLDRGKYLYSRRYLYVIEWQKNTEQVHFHILLDASYIPWDSLLTSWSKHRPPEAGEVVGDRPKFGTVIFTAPKFDSDPVYAARYATKYLIKTPEHGFPEWVLDMGKDRRIRRFDTSKGFWGNPPKPHVKNPDSKRTRKAKSYRERLAICGKSVNIIEIASVVDPGTGEITAARQWVGQLDAEASAVIPKLFDPGNPDRTRRSLLAQSPGHAKRIIEAAAGKELQWLRYRNTINKK